MFTQFLTLINYQIEENCEGGSLTYTSSRSTVKYCDLGVVVSRWREPELGKK
jgi:hypothetical protein